ncbi:MAG: hypothetical protein DMG02_34170 [Acidobacteria bacterium]|nr:MAG: hypothetical protein DMG02_34170 [Acidobacteriota bacterium]
MCPPLRCYAQVGSSRYAICGELARWRRPGAHWFDDKFVCDAHREPSDVAIAGEIAVRRVRVELEVFVAGASRDAPFAQSEALARISAAVIQAGGVVDVQRVRSAFVAYPATATSGLQNALVGVPR